MPLAVVLGIKDYVKPLQLQHKTVPAAHLFCSLVTTVYPVQLLPFCNKTDIFDCRSFNSPGLCQDVFILSHRFGIFSAQTRCGLLTYTHIRVDYKHGETQTDRYVFGHNSEKITRNYFR
jgi:hypothetical protein